MRMKDTVRIEKNKIICFVLSAVMILSLTGCDSGALGSYRPFEDNGHVHVVTSIFAAYDFARSVGGDYADVKLLLKPGSEAHSFEPTPRDIIAIEKCDVFICTGGENDAWVDTILDAIDNPNLKIIRMTECVDALLTEEEVEGMQGEGGMLSELLGEEHHHHEHGDDEADHEEADHDESDHDESDHDESDHDEEWDEHVWMDIDNAIAICEVIADTFTEIVNEAADKTADTAAFTANCEAYAAQLRAVDDEIKDIVNKAPRTEVIFADRFPARYFTERYGLTYSAAFPGCSESTEASAATVSHLINKVREDEVPVIFKMELSSGKLATVVSEETGAEIGTFYTGHNVTAEDFENGITFTDMMQKNAELLKNALCND